jgi:raffinose/stachyose/melibiose transport system permease protein
MTTTTLPVREARPGQRSDRLLWPGRPGRRYLYMVPATVFFGLFIAYPIVDVVKSSVAIHDTASHGHGVLANFEPVLTDPVFWTAAKNMALWAVLTIVVQMVIGGSLAYVIENYTRRSRALFRTAFFLPVVTSVSVIAIVWEQIYAPNYGPLQDALAKVGVHYSNSLIGDPRTAIFALIAVNVWEFTGFSMLLYTVGLNRVPGEILESARIDGAAGLRLIRHIIVPMLSDVTRSLVLLGIIGALQTFPLVYLMTSGGPDNASQVFGTYIFNKAFIENENGYASALSVITLVVALIATLIQVGLLGSRLDVSRSSSAPAVRS